MPSQFELHNGYSGSPRRAARAVTTHFVSKKRQSRSGGRPDVSVRTSVFGTKGGTGGIGGNSTARTGATTAAELQDACARRTRFIRPRYITCWGTAASEREQVILRVGSEEGDRWTVRSALVANNELRAAILTVRVYLEPHAIGFNRSLPKRERNTGGDSKIILAKHRTAVHCAAPGYKSPGTFLASQQAASRRGRRGGEAVSPREASGARPAEAAP
jgi:hypothetical protein